MYFEFADFIILGIDVSFSGGVAFQSLRVACLNFAGVLPYNMLYLVGVHTGAGAYALEKTNPSLASLSKLGVS